MPGTQTNPYPEFRDTLQRFSLEHTAVRGEIVHLESAWRTIVAKKDYPPVVRDLLGELTITTILLSASIRFSGSLTVQIKGDGPVSFLVVECTSDRTIRALAHWQEENLSTTIDALMGRATLVMTLDPENSKERYQSIIDLGGKSIASAIEDYLLHSNNLYSRFRVATDKRRAAGMLLQADPQVETVNEGPWQSAVDTCKNFSSIELLELPARELLMRFYHQAGIRVFDDEPISFECSCSGERVSNVIRMLGQKEVMDILDDEGVVKIECEFCGQNYEYDAIDIMQLFHSGASPTQSLSRH